MGVQARNVDVAKEVEGVSLVEVFVTFARIGAFTFGGGLAMLPLFEREVIDSKGWISREEVLDIYAISQSIPGVIAGNAAAFIGYRLAGIAGAVAALMGVMVPSLIVIIAIATYFTQFRENFYVAKALQGARASVAALIILAAVRIGRASLKNTFSVVLATLALLMALLTDVDMIYVILAGGLLGMFACRITSGGGQQ
ncbi:MAG: chromate transporter [Limnochordia bacterium]